MAQKKRKQAKPKTDKLNQTMDGLGVDFNTLMQSLVQPSTKEDKSKKA
ncbi:hypothetical protein [Mucilaginibacter sp. R-33]